MSDWVNFREIRERIPIERVIREYYQVDDLKITGKTATCPCPVHGGDNPRGFHIDFEKNLWHCFTKCKKGGNQLDLVAAKDGVTVREAALRLQRFFLGDDDGHPPPSAPAGVSGPRPSGPRPSPAAAAATVGRPKRQAPVNPPLTLSLQLLPDHPHIVQDRRLLSATADDFGVGYCARGILAGSIAFPICNEDGVLVAYAGRRLKWSDIEQEGKYRFPKGFRKDHVLYNLHRALPHAAKGLVLVEGFFSVLKLFEAGVSAVAAVMGSDLSEHQAALAAKANHVIVLFDGNEAGRKGAASAAGRLTEIGVPVTLVELPEGWEPEDCTRQQLAWLYTAADLESGAVVH
jgi:DNA primase